MLDIFISAGTAQDPTKTTVAQPVVTYPEIEYRPATTLVAGFSISVQKQSPELFSLLTKKTLTGLFLICVDGKIWTSDPSFMSAVL